MPIGRIIKALSGFYYVDYEGRILQCRARGKFRVDGITPMVGDNVSFEVIDQQNGYIIAVLPRKNQFVRPMVSNLDYIVILVSAVNPVTDPFLADRVAVIAEHMNCGVIICINKCDKDLGNSLYEAFSVNTGYPVIRTSAYTGAGVHELVKLIEGHTVAFTGNSGVGKSSLLNKISPELNLATGDVSDRLGRGRHTTRHVELYDINGTFIADTPGFSSFDLTQMQPIRKEELQHDFPEFRKFIGSCRFDNCFHIKEPGCAVLSAVNSGEVSQSRYNSYVKLFEISASYKDWENKA